MNRKKVTKKEMNETINDFADYLYMEAELDNAYEEEGIELKKIRKRTTTK